MRSSSLWRWTCLVAGLVFAAAAAVNVAAVVGGEQVSGGGLVGLGLVTLIAVLLLFSALVLFRIRVEVDERRAVLVVRTLGTRTIDLSRPTTVTYSIRIRRRTATRIHDWRLRVERDGELQAILNSLTIGDLTAFTTSLQGVLRLNPDLPGDEPTRRVIEDPTLLDDPTKVWPDA